MTQHKKEEINRIERLGGKIHKILNNTLIRKLTLKEYKKLLELIGIVFIYTVSLSPKREE